MLARLADGDREAFHPVFLGLQPILRRFCLRHLRPEEAEDAAQEALLKVFAQAARYDRRRDALAWALTLTTFEIRTARRRHQRRREEALDPDTARSRPGVEATPEAAAITASQDAWLDHVLQSLSPVDAATLRAYANDVRPAEVAPATFRKRVERGLGRVRRLLGLDAPGTKPTRSDHRSDT